MITPLHKTVEAVEGFMSDEDRWLFNENDVSLIAQKVDEDMREVSLDEKIYDSLIIHKDTIMESL